MDRYHNFDLLLYFEPTIFNSIISEDANILHYAYIYHDKDVVTTADINNNARYTINDLNRPKEPHYHLLINYKNAKTFNACLTQFTIPSYNTRVIPIKENQKQERFEYLWHLNNPDKFQYEKELVITDSANFWINVQNGNTEKTVNLINDIINKRPLRELMETYGRDFVINCNKYFMFAEQLVSSERLHIPPSIPNAVVVETKNGVIIGTEDNTTQFDFLLNETKND